MRTMRVVTAVRVCLVAVAVLSGVVASVQSVRGVGGGTSAAVPAIFGFWLMVALLVWWATARLIGLVARRLPPKTGFDFTARDVYASSVVGRLPAGEELVDFVPVFVTSFVQGKLPPSRGTTLHFYGLALTTVGLRWVTFSIDKVDAGRFRKVQRLSNRVVSESFTRMSEITTVDSSNARCPRVDVAIRAFGSGFRSPLDGVSPRDSLLVHGLKVTTKDGKSRTAWSPYREMPVLVKNLNALRSGDFLAARAVGASGAFERLQRMLQDGVISAEEFDRLKAGFVGTTTTQLESTESRIRQLHSLMRDGILTESEFRQKKWDLLSASR